MANIKKKKGTIAILTGGGDVPGLNPAIRAVTIRALREGYKVIGLRRGWAGIMSMIAAIGIFVFLPWLDRSSVRSMRYKGILSRTALTIFAFCFLGLGYFGLVHVTPTRTVITQFLGAGYFLFFLLMPLYTGFERSKPVPERVTK